MSFIFESIIFSLKEHGASATLQLTTMIIEVNVAIKLRAHFWTSSGYVKTHVSFMSEKLLHFKGIITYLNMNVTLNSKKRQFCMIPDNK